MEVRNRVREAYAARLNVEIRPVIRKKIDSLKHAGVEFESFNHAFTLGYIAGMENPSFDAVVESIKVMRLFGDLDGAGKEIIMLVMDGMKARYQDPKTKDKGDA